MPNKLPTGDIILAAEAYGIKGSTACVDALLDRVNGVDVSALRLLVMEAFKANSQGFLSTGRVLSLMRMEVNSEKWREAKRILQEALKPEKGKQYLICERRKTTQGDFRAIRLDIADARRVFAMLDTHRRRLLRKWQSRSAFSTHVRYEVNGPIVIRQEVPSDYYANIPFRVNWL